MMRFADRREAGRALAVALAAYKGEPVVVYALPRGGVGVAVEVAKALHAPLDLLLVRKIGAPMQPELALGAIVDGGKPVIVRNTEVINLTGTKAREFDKIAKIELSEIARRRYCYRSNLPDVDPSGKIAIVVDDGIATGASVRAALLAMKERGPKKTVLAVPVAPPDAIAALEGEADEIVCLEAPAYFNAVGSFYRDFHQMDDNEVNMLLKESALEQRGPR